MEPLNKLEILSLVAKYCYQLPMDQEVTMNERMWQSITSSIESNSNRQSEQSTEQQNSSLGSNIVQKAETISSLDALNEQENLKIDLNSNQTVSEFSSTETETNSETEIEQSLDSDDKSEFAQDFNEEPKSELSSVAHVMKLTNEIENWHLSKDLNVPKKKTKMSCKSEVMCESNQQVKVKDETETRKSKNKKQMGYGTLNNSISSSVQEESLEKSATNMEPDDPKHAQQLARRRECYARRMSDPEERAKQREKWRNYERARRSAETSEQRMLRNMKRSATQRARYIRLISTEKGRLSQKNKNRYYYLKRKEGNFFPSE
ncbi:hypothetical protein RDWZM_002800 [Blomia tropicalis]|uniref:Uncharacterized protein n=1 Tax=Blomia tropicalis TaxID=40697 RepID=A0A9Q0MIG2_BLOTA|nr:hypothetical protein RDWZM_002800 [Blomia tropicalis]